MRLVGKYYDSNVFIVEKNNKVLIVDAGVEVERVKKEIGDKEVVGILLTHGHFDHCYFVEDYQKAFNVKVYASNFIREYLEDPKKNYSTDFENSFLKIGDFDNFVFLSECGVLKVGDFEISYKQLGGHSKSDMCFVVDNEVFVGDVVLGRAIGRMDLFGGNKEEMEKSLTYLKNLDYQVMHCGHGEDFEKKAQDKVCGIYLKFLSR